MKTENGKKLLTQISNEMTNELTKARKLAKSFNQTKNLVTARQIAKKIQTCFDNHARLQKEIGTLTMMENLFVRR